ncbi:MAG: T9SS type A sorting domain-containing protein [Bacteroidota bacterium]
MPKAPPAVVVYPNPVDNMLTVESSMQNYQIQVWNIAGARVISETCTSGRTALDMSMLNPGLYILTILNDNGTLLTSEKISVQH